MISRAPNILEFTQNNLPTGFDTHRHTERGNAVMLRETATSHAYANERQRQRERVRKREIRPIAVAMMLMHTCCLSFHEVFTSRETIKKNTLAANRRNTETRKRYKIFATRNTSSSRSSQLTNLCVRANNVCCCCCFYYRTGRAKKRGTYASWLFSVQGGRERRTQSSARRGGTTRHRGNRAVLFVHCALCVSHHRC